LLADDYDIPTLRMCGFVACGVVVVVVIRGSSGAGPE